MPRGSPKVVGLQGEAVCRRTKSLLKERHRFLPKDSWTGGGYKGAHRVGIGICPTATIRNERNVLRLVVAKIRKRMRRGGDLPVTHDGHQQESVERTTDNKTQ